METRFSDECGELFGALSKAQAEITGAAKSADNPFFKSKYADLAACLDAIREPLAKNSLCVIQTTQGDGGGVTVVTTLGHSSGQWARGFLTMVPEKKGPQALGACTTYARRYALAAITGLAQIDDDAEAASAHKGKPDVIAETVWAEANKQAMTGTEALKAWFTALPKPQKEVLGADGKRWDVIKGVAVVSDNDAIAHEAA